MTIQALKINQGTKFGTLEHARDYFFDLMGK